MNPKIFEYYSKFTDVLFYHSLDGNYNFNSFVYYLQCLFDKLDEYSIFMFSLTFMKSFLLKLEEEDAIFFIKPNSDKFHEINLLLSILARSSACLKDSKITKETKQEILNIFSTLLLIKLFNFDKIEISSKFKFNDFNEYIINLLDLAHNLPPLIFNKNSNFTNPIKIELKYHLFAILNEKPKLISDEFKDFSEK